MSGRIASALSIDPGDLHESLLKLILRVCAFVGTLVYLPSVYFALKNGMAGVVVVDTVGLFTLIALLCIPWFARLPFSLRAGVACLLFYAIGVGLLMEVGAISQIYLFGFSLLTVLLLGTRAGLYAAGLSAATLFAVGVLGRAAPEMAIPGWRSDSKEWMVIALDFALVNAMLTLAVGAVLAAMNRALNREIASRASLDAERSLLLTLIDALPDAVFTKDTSGGFMRCNPAMLALLGLDREDQAAGKTVFELFSRELAEPYHADDLRVMTGERVLNREEQSIDSRGKPIWYLTIKVPLRDPQGEIVGLIGISRDITDRKRLEAERDRLLAQLQLQIERMPLAYLLSDADFHYTRWNPAAERLFGFGEAEVLGKHPFEVIVPPQSQRFVGGVFERLKAGRMDAHGESENLTKGGAIISCEWHNTPLFDEGGVFVGLLSLAQDITARKELAEQLRQAQKMEAVGRLAGGVAHDFNNLLSVILSYTSLFLHDLRRGDPMHADMQEIEMAARRATELTGQLLAFSRQQVLQPRVIDINQIVAGMERMLPRLLGEDVELAVRPGRDIGRVLADPGQIEQVVMNLAVNARDAMPAGGKLTIETANVELDAAYAEAHVGVDPGEYVMLAISDTGTGMDAATQARIFEPFFTTKEKGKGTGLGLSTVFGIVKQSGGHLGVYSEPGQGSTFKVYLSRTDRVDVAPTRSALPPGDLRGSETILLVEDEPQVRAVASAILRRNGYHVLASGNGGEAFLISKSFTAAIHLLLTDVVMPRMSGRKLAEELAPQRPAMKVLFASGYADDAVVHHGVLAAGVAFIQKPFTPETLLRKVREVLDAGTLSS